jgi:hypothetical protein
MGGRSEPGPRERPANLDEKGIVGDGLVNDAGHSEFVERVPQAAVPE